MKYSILEKILVALFTFISHIIFARALSPSEYGDFLYHQAIFFILIQVVAFGIKNNYFMLYKYSRYRGDIFSIICEIRFFIFCITVLLIIIIFDDFKITLIYSISLFFVIDVFEWDKEYTNDFKLIFIVRFFVLSTLMIVKLILINIYNHYYIALILWLIELPCCYIIYYFIFNKRIKITLVFNKKIISLLIKRSFPIFIASVVGIIYSRMDQIMLNNLMQARDVAIFSIAQKLTEPFTIFAYGIVSYSVPKIIKATVVDKYAIIKKYFILLIGLSFVIALFMITFGDKFVDIFGRDYQESKQILPYMCLTIPFYFFSSYFASILVLEKHSKLIFYKSIIGLSVNLSLNYILIPLLGVKGVVISTIIALFISNIILTLLFRRSRKIIIKILKG
ncbi:MATE family efflux transporter [Photobacterium leiognathi]|uniref:MATE family efflux transporter n=1 Tax=Photobacterium leiognathi TaxID=553611 RepID=UPI0029814834|nr:polysaccharide biosynthesis C-terminal domain-containing protein [Photobacterium leiognathi]